MAVRNVNEGVGQWNSSFPFPQNRYTLVCVEEEVGPSKKGHPMITRTWEIHAPETIQIGEKILNIAGQKVTQYVLTKYAGDEPGTWDEKKSDNFFRRAADELIAMGWNPADPIDDENPPCFAKGKTMDAILGCDTRPMLQEPTPEQRAKNQPGSPILDNNNKPVINYDIRLVKILGPSSTQVGVAY